jgi:large subunit ribosomal protein L27
MAHKKAGGAKARQGSNTAGKRLGVKLFAGQLVKPGQIIVRQRGRTLVAGENTKMGKDYTIFAMKPGKVGFKWITRKKKAVVVEPEAKKKSS